MPTTGQANWPCFLTNWRFQICSLTSIPTNMACKTTINNIKIYIYIHIHTIICFRYINYNDLTATSLESWLIRGIIPKWNYFRLVNYFYLPENIIYVYIDVCVCVSYFFIGWALNPQLPIFSSFPQDLMGFGSVLSAMSKRAMWRHALVLFEEALAQSLRRNVTWLASKCDVCASKCHMAFLVLY